LSLPRGCLDDALALLKENNIGVQIDDKRELGIKLTGMKPLLALRKNQQAAVKEMSKHDAGILHAPTAFGKTVTAIGMITRRKANTLILVHSRQLLDQWKERLRAFLPKRRSASSAAERKSPPGSLI
jgi:superfamily II DNA or RNA helicase